MNSLLAADSVSYSYDASVPVIRDWSAEFAAGEVVAITAPSGRGKSTLLYLLGLMLRPKQGRVLLDGRAVHALPDQQRAVLRAHDFGFVFQDAVLDQSRTVLDNILEAALYRGDDRRAAVARADELMDRFGVSLRRDAKPGQVSGGQAQRVALCRALLGRPRIVLADEPTGNLDPASSDLVVAALHEHADHGGASIVVTHDPTLVARCDRKISL